MEPAKFPDCRIALDDIACRRGDRILFSGLSLLLTGGGGVHLSGANGIGKSSLLRIIAGLMRPYAGTASVTGAVAMLDEHLALDTHVPLGSALAFWFRCDGTGAARQAEILELTGLNDLLDVPVRFLSTGQRKRAALARTLGRGAPIWLLDEPLNGLDTASAAMVAMLVERHCADGGICIAASHQPVDVAGWTRLDLAEFAT